MRISSIIGLVLLFCCLSMAGCSKPESVLVGKWVGSTGSFEFFKDKTGIVSPPKGRADLPANVPFKWSVVGSDEVRMYLAIGEGKTVLGKLGKNALIIEDDKFVKQQ
jgi:hypothetical protein